MDLAPLISRVGKVLKADALVLRVRRDREKKTLGEKLSNGTLYAAHRMS